MPEIENTLPCCSVSCHGTVHREPLPWPAWKEHDKGKPADCVGQGKMSAVPWLQSPPVSPIEDIQAL